MGIRQGGRRLLRRIIDRAYDEGEHAAFAELYTQQRQLEILRRAKSEHLEVGRQSYGEPRVVTYPGDTAKIRIGQFSSIGTDVDLMPGGGHDPSWVTTFAFRARYGLPGAFEDGIPVSKGDIVIGNDVWVARGAKVLSGVTIGDGAVVGAYSVVTKDVRPYAIVAGAPAREIRRRFSDEQVEALLQIRWWDWPEDRILEAVPLLCADDVDAFIAAAGATPSPAAPATPR